MSPAAVVIGVKSTLNERCVPTENRVKTVGHATNVADVTKAGKKFQRYRYHTCNQTPEVRKLFSCSTQLSMKFFLHLLAFQHLRAGKIVF